MILYCHWLEFWSHDTYIFIILSVISIKNVKILKSNNNRSNPKFLRLLWDIVVFRLVVYLLNMIRLNLLFFLQDLISIDFRINLTVLNQFLETGKSDKTFMGLAQLLKCVGFTLYPLSFFLYNPFKEVVKRYGYSYFFCQNSFSSKSI